MIRSMFSLAIVLLVLSPAVHTQAQRTYLLEHYNGFDSCGTNCYNSIVGGFIETDGTLGDVPDGDDPGQLRSVITDIEVTIDENTTQLGGEKTFRPLDPFIDLFSDGPGERVVTFTETHVLLKDMQTLKVFENTALRKNGNLVEWINQEGTGDPGRRVQIRGGTSNIFGQYRFSASSGDLIVATVPDVICSPACSWITNGTGYWNDINHWRIDDVPGVPDSNAEGAIFGDAIAASTTIVVDTDTVVNSIQIDNHNSYVVAGSKTLSLESGTPGAPAIWLVSRTNPVTHEFQVRTALNDSTTVRVGNNITLEFNNRLSLGGNTLTKTGGGTVSINNVLNSAGGTLDCSEGTCAGSGTVGGNLVNQGTVAPGSSPGILTVDGDYTQGSSGTLAIEIAGLVPGEDHDKLVVTGAANLAGTLDVTLLNGFTPNNGDTFDILDFASVTGDFSTLNLPASFNWNVSTGALTFGAAIGGFADYDNDGTWNLGDLNLVLFNWQQNEGSLPAEWVNQRPAAVGLDSLNQVLFNWQQASSLATVPEPTSGLLLLMVLLAVGIQRCGYPAEGNSRN